MLQDTLQIECACIPTNPFYIRWLNRYAGFDYQMFQKRQLFEHSQSDVITHEPFITDYETATGTQKLVSKSVEQTVIIGAEHLTIAEWDIILYVINSALVQYFNVEQQRWLDVIIDKPKAQRQTDDGLHTIELTLILPKPQLAI